jgi:ankyrin repeat protein
MRSIMLRKKSLTGAAALSFDVSSVHFDQNAPRETLTLFNTSSDAFLNFGFRHLPRLSSPISDHLSGPSMASDVFQTINNSRTWGPGHAILLHNIPWFRFQRLLRPNPLASQVLFSASYPLMRTRGAVEMPSDYPQELLSKLLPSTGTDVGMHSLSALESLVTTATPERFEGEGSEKLRELIDPYVKCTAEKFVEFALPFISNNLATEEGTRLFFEWIAKEKLIGLFKPLFHMKNYTARAICFQLLKYIANHGKGSDLQFLLDAGIDKGFLSGPKGGCLLRMALAAKANNTSFVLPSEENAKNVDIVWILLDHYPDVNPVQDRWTDEPPLHIAARLGLLAIMQRLLQTGSQLENMFEGTTAIQEAVLYGHWDAAYILLQAGAKPDSVKIDGLLLADWACLTGKIALYEMLEQRSDEKLRLSISHIIVAAKEGLQYLTRYLSSKESNKKRELLEGALYHSLRLEAHKSAVPVLLESGVDPNIKVLRQEENVQHPLTLAVEQGGGYEDMVLLLFHYGADVSSPGVLESIIGEHSSLFYLQIFLSKMPDIEKGGQQAITKAVACNELAPLQLLVSLGVDLNHLDCDGFSHLQKACLLGYPKMVQYLVQSGSDINAPPTRPDNFTALHCAVAAGNVNIVRYLMKNANNAIQQCNSYDGYTLLEVCSQNLQYYGNWMTIWTEEREEIFKILLTNGANINGPTNRKVFSWNSALTELILKERDEELIRLAINAGADVNCKGSGWDARSPLQAAAEVGNVQLVKELIDRGAVINSPAAVLYGRTALQAACSAKVANYDLVKFLLDNGADVNADAGIEGGVTALQGAAIRGHIKVVLLLLDYHADVNAPCAAIKGRTALEGAAEHGRLDMVQIIMNATLAAGERDILLEDRSAEFARRNSHFVVAELIESQSWDASKGMNSEHSAFQVV